MNFLEKKTLSNSAVLSVTGGNKSFRMPLIIVFIYRMKSYFFPVVYIIHVRINVCVHVPRETSMFRKTFGLRIIIQLFCRKEIDTFYKRTSRRLTPPFALFANPPLHSSEQQPYSKTITSNVLKTRKQNNLSFFVRKLTRNISSSGISDFTFLKKKNYCFVAIFVFKRT